MEHRRLAARRLLGGYLLFFWLDLDRVYLVALAAVVLAAALLTVRILALPRLAVVLLMLAPALAILSALPRWDPNPLASATFRMRQARAEDRLWPKAFFGASPATRASPSTTTTRTPPSRCARRCSPTARPVDRHNGKPTARSTSTTRRWRSRR